VLVAHRRRSGVVLAARHGQARTDSHHRHRPWPPPHRLGRGQARGIALLAPATAGLPVAEYPPNLIKKTVVGAGHAEKHQIQAMIGFLLPKAQFESADEADALAIAICHASHRSSRALAQPRTVPARLSVER